MRKHWQEQANSVIVSVIIQIFSHPPFSLKSLHIFPLNTRLNIFKLPQEGKKEPLGGKEMKHTELMEEPFSWKMFFIAAVTGSEG